MAFSFNPANGYRDTSQFPAKPGTNARGQMQSLLDQVKDYINNTEIPNITASAPPGKVDFFAGNTAPSGWLKANGAAVDRTAYANLFSYIGTKFGAGNGTTTFNLPDLRGEFVRGWDDSRGVDSGRTFGSSQTDDFKSHQHVEQAYASINAASGGTTGFYGLQNQGGAGGIMSQSTSPTGGTETRPRNIALLACIKY